MKEKPQTDAHSHGTRSYLGSITVTSRFFNINNEERQRKKRVQQAQKSVLRSPNEPQLHLLLAWRLADNNQLQDAVLAWNKGLLLLPFDEDIDVGEDGVQAQTNALSRYVFGVILFKGGAVEQARAEWKKASALDKYGIGDLARRKLKEHLETSTTE